MPPKGYFRRTKGVFAPGATGFPLSRSKIDLFVECPRCFYLDRRLGVPRPSMPGFTLNVAVDHLLKKEFDEYRAKGEPHPLMTAHGVDAVPFRHAELDEWRHNFTGVRHAHEPTGFTVFGAVDDVWVSPSGELYIVDYKATSKQDKPDLDGFWQQAYKRQMEVYQWLFRRNGFSVSPVGYFVYVNGRKGEERFDGALKFDTDVIAYEGDDGWVEETLARAKATLESNAIPEVGKYCEHCPYREAAGKAIREVYGVNTEKTGGGGAAVRVPRISKKSEADEHKNETLF